MHKLITIGWTGIKTAYLDISKEEAIKRYEADNNEKAVNIDEFEFKDEFQVYEAWGLTQG